MQNIYATLLLIFAFSQSATAQTTEPDARRDYDPRTEEVYAVKPLLEGGLGIAGLAATTYFFQEINDKGSFDATVLNRDDVPGIDRWSLPDNSDKVDDAKAASDAVFYPSIALPFTLFVSKKIRKDWLDITAMYLEAQAVNGLLYAVSPLGPNFNDRRRPQAYLTDIDDDARGDEGNLNSFFSGHVSTAATGSFFFAKVLSDYNPQWTGRQRALAFGAASLPPLFVGVKRVQGLRHFPSDVAVGFGVGALIGILTPEIHKRWQRNHRSSLSISGGYGEGAGGLGLSLVF